MSIFGNSALARVFEGDTEFAQLAIDSPESGWYALLEQFPGAAFLLGLATLSGLLFYLTSANSGAMVMSNFSSSIPDPADDGAKWLRTFWAILTALLTIAMLVAGGVTTMEYATLIFALPVTVIAYLVMASFSKVLRMERAEREGRARRHRGLAVHSGPAPEKTWRQRLARMRSFPSAKSAGRFLTEVAQPALEAVAAEFRTQGGPVALIHETNEETGLTDSVLRVDMGEHRSFLYQVTAVAYRVPTYGARSAARRPVEDVTPSSGSRSSPATGTSPVSGSSSASGTDEGRVIG